MTHVENADALIRIFGHWPSFHSAEVVSIHLDRRGRGANRGPTIEAMIHVWEQTDETDATGQYVFRDQTLVTLRFLQVDNLQLSGFNEQNALHGLGIIDLSDRQLEDVKFEVHFESHFHEDRFTFVCKAVVVADVQPWI